MAKKWLITRPAADLDAAAANWGMPPLLAQLLLNRGQRSDQSVDGFLTPRLRDLHPPDQLPGATQAAEIIASAIADGTPIVLYGDYDVDGTTGVAILWHILKQAGAQVSFYVPHRIEEGYGVNIKAIRGLLDQGAGLIVTIDCGITSVEIAEELAGTDTRFIVTDHHTAHDKLPRADAIVHPGIAGEYPNPDLCGAGVAYKLGWAIARALSGSEKVDAAYRDLLVELLPLAALGTIADVVPLQGENRIIARHGIGGIATSKLAGLRALVEASGLRGRSISGYDVGFKLAPRINAAGRMGHARLAVELLTSANETRAQEIALYLDDHNRSRQSLERKIRDQAFEQIEKHNLASDARRAIVVAGEGWHAGVIGIVASRIVGRYHRPAVVIALSEGEGQASARSVRHFDLCDALKSCEEHLITYGGHKMAAGFRLSADRIEPFTSAFVEVANNRLTGDDLIERITIDASVSLKELTLPTTEAILSLGPFGHGNPRPKLATEWVTVVDEPRLVGKKQDHLQICFREDGVQVKGIGFGLGGVIEDLKEHRKCRVAFEPIINEFNGRRSVELQILDMKFPPS